MGMVHFGPYEPWCSTEIRELYNKVPIYLFLHNLFRYLTKGWSRKIFVLYNQTLF